MDLNTLVDLARGALRNGPPLRIAAVFGSAARGSSHAGSDVDLAIWPRDEELSLEAELDLQVKLERAIGRQVDLVRLDRASTLVRWEVARQGALVLAEPPWEWTRFVARAASDYGDFQPALAEAVRRLHRRLTQGAT